jgi:hypothetical protein
MTLAPAHDIQRDAGQRERAQQAERIHITERRHIAADHDEYQNGNTGSQDDRDMRRLPPLIRALHD